MYLSIGSNKFKTFNELLKLRETKPELFPCELYFDDLKFDWIKNIRLFKFKNQNDMKMILKFRKNYVRYIKKKSISGNVCLFKFVGSKDSIVSDIDINIICKKHEDVNKYISEYHDVLENINNYHYELFKSDSGTLFDVNVYASQFHFGDKYNPCLGKNCFSLKSPLSQRGWAFMRCAKLIDEYKLPIKDSYMANVYQLSKNIKIKQKSYNSHVSTFLKLAFGGVGKDNIFEAFSNMKSVESDAYYSVGAYLHIVDGRNDLHRSFYEDSILDNFGFMVENLYSEDQSVMSLARVAKYIERVCHAALCISFNENIFKYYTLANKINSARKNDKLTKSLVCKIFTNIVNMPIKNCLLITNEQKWKFATIFFKHFDYIFIDLKKLKIV